MFHLYFWKIPACRFPGSQTLFFQGFGDAASPCSHADPAGVCGHLSLCSSVWGGALSRAVFNIFSSSLVLSNVLRTHPGVLCLGFLGSWDLWVYSFPQIWNILTLFCYPVLRGIYLYSKLIWRIFQVFGINIFFFPISFRFYGKFHRKYKEFPYTLPHRPNSSHYKHLN